MKYILLILLICPLLSSGQTNCKTLSTIKAFRGLAFGETIPDSIFDQAELSYDKKSIMFQARTIKKNGKEHLLKYLYFDAPPDVFSSVYFTFTQERKLYSVYLRKPFDYTDSILIRNGKIPIFFRDLYDKVSEMFGSYSDNKLDTAKADLVGITQTYIWDCGNMELELVLSYGGLVEINCISLEIIDLNTKRKGLIKGLQN